MATIWMLIHDFLYSSDLYHLFVISSHTAEVTSVKQKRSKTFSEHQMESKNDGCVNYCFFYLFIGDFFSA